MAQPDYLIAGAGIIGLSLALELHGRGASVMVLEAGAAMQQTSTAAAGMLAVDDPQNPPALKPLASLSVQLYPAWLDRIAELAQTRVPFQTTSTLQSAHDNLLPDPQALVPQLARGTGYTLLPERSIDPRQLAPALLAAVRATSITLREHTALERIQSSPSSVRINDEFEASCLIDCMGAWSPAPVTPRKGQMLAVTLPAALTDLETTIRTEGPDAVYIVPRTLGPHAGRAIVGATVEDAGFDLTVHPGDILTLNQRAVALLPALADAGFLESWSGLRPSTPDGLPYLGRTARQPRYVLANGHFRNGILLAPATAHVMAQLLLGEPTALDLTPFSPNRTL